MIHEFVTFCGRYAPDFAHQIRGATEKEIAQLENLAGRKLPSTYRQFLAAMGKAAGGIHAPDADYDIQLVLGFYKRHGRSWSSDFIFIGELNIEPAVDYYLEHDKPDAPDGMIVGFDRDQRPSRDKAWAYFPSLQDMLFWSAFNRLRVLRLPYRKTFAPRLIRQNETGEHETATTLAAVADVATQMGFRRLAYTSHQNPIFERHDAAILGHQKPDGEGFSFDLAAEQERELRRMSQVLLDNLSVQFSLR